MRGYILMHCCLACEQKVNVRLVSFTQLKDANILFWHEDLYVWPLCWHDVDALFAVPNSLQNKQQNAAKRTYLIVC